MSNLKQLTRALLPHLKNSVLSEETLEEALEQALKDEALVIKDDAIDMDIPIAVHCVNAQYPYHNTLRQLTKAPVNEFDVLFTRFQQDIVRHQWDLNKIDNRHKNTWSIINDQWPTTNKKTNITEKKRNNLRRLTHFILDFGINPLNSELPLREFYQLSNYLVEELEQRESTQALRDEQGNSLLHQLVSNKMPTFRLQLLFENSKGYKSWIDTTNYAGFTPLQLVWLNGEAQYLIDNQDRFSFDDFQNNIYSLWTRTYFLLNEGASMSVDHPQTGILLEVMADFKNKGLTIPNHPPRSIHLQNDHDLALFAQEQHRVAYQRYCLDQKTDPATCDTAVRRL